ncbi:hypothetical protein BKA70DRAFT_1556839 [Coprinopsis sp. MPI-PUGE-AT-0042]|nr:hypothetical protein BKA70DRAFT_1556839 [Coprinopsis sp. MPI-PUGE-AT-0042]
MGSLAYGSFAYTTNAVQKTPLSFTYSHDPNAPLEITVADTAPLHSVGAMGDTLGTSNGNAFYLVRSNPVPYGPSQIVGHSAASGPRQSQTLIWKFNPVTNELSGTWVNPDGTVLPTIWYIPPGGTNIRVSAHPNLILQKVRLYWDA